jgi:aconitate hydratase
MGATFDLVAAGARLHQTGCLGCIGMGQAPSSWGNSLRTMPRNFPGRSGTADDHVYLCSPETAAASSLTGEITDPRTLPDALGIAYPEVELPERSSVNVAMLEAPLPAEEAAGVVLVKGDNIGELPDFEPLADEISAPVLVKVGDDISTDTIMPAGAKALPYRSNIEKLSEFAFGPVDQCCRWSSWTRPTTRPSRPTMSCRSSAFVTSPPVPTSSSATPPRAASTPPVTVSRLGRSRSCWPEA